MIFILRIQSIFFYLFIFYKKFYQTSVSPVFMKLSLNSV